MHASSVISGSAIEATGLTSKKNRAVGGTGGAFHVVGAVVKISDSVCTEDASNGDGGGGFLGVGIYS